MSEIPRDASGSAPLNSEDADTTRPSAARAYDYYLGGDSNFPVDREFGDRILERVPFVRDFARTNRAFLRRAVTWLCERGIDQFLDIGSGIPTVDSVHEIVQRSQPAARTVYVDHDPVAVAHTSTILDHTDPDRARTGVLRADLRGPAEILHAPVTTELIDFTRPVGLLIVATMHFIAPDDDPRALLAHYRDALPTGSHLAISHLTLDGVPEQLREQGRDLERMYARTPNAGYFRERAEITALLDGYEIVPPGLVWAPEWHPEHEQPNDPATTATLAAVARKP
ncbi:SAM-dependent methyltransferase [Actinopolyspora sp. H202]|uniref:SAM-dependent methyltransferase n=1 Tax=Actinopolyspora sp. H202 TaxID=1500456 RepID=UPI003EE69949